VSYRYELALCDTGPVLCRALDILDDRRRPFGFGQAPNPRDLERGRAKRRYVMIAVENGNDHHRNRRRDKPLTDLAPKSLRKD